jgi:hypothetical protein
MKVIGKISVIILLAALTFFSINAAQGGKTITIEGTGQPWASSTPQGNVKYGCDPVTQNSCTITIQVFDQ